MFTINKEQVLRAAKASYPTVPTDQEQLGTSPEEAAKIAQKNRVLANKKAMSQVNELIPIH